MPAGRCYLAWVLRLSSIAVSLTALACGQGPDAPRAVEHGSDVQAGWYYSLDEQLRPLIDGGRLPVRQAPQGGHWAFLSARVRGIHDGEMEVKAHFYDMTSGEVIFASRRVGELAPSEAAPGYVEPDLDLRGAIVHLPACPFDAALPVFGRPLRLLLEVRGTGPEGASGSTELVVTPDCAEGTPGELAVCECECATDYEPGKCY